MKSYTLPDDVAEPTEPEGPEPMAPVTLAFLLAARAEARTRGRVGPVRNLALGVFAAAREEWIAAGCPDAVAKHEKQR